MSKDNLNEKENRTIFIVIAVILLIAIGIIITWYFTKDKKEDKKVEKPKVKEVVKKDETKKETKEVVSYIPEVENLAVTTEETVSVSNPTIKYSNILERTITNHNGVVTNGASLEVFKDAAAYDYKGDTANLSVTILGYKQDGTKVNLTDSNYIPTGAGIVKIEIIYTATDSDGRETVKSVSFKVESGIESITFENAVLDKEYDKTVYDYELTVDSNATQVKGIYVSDVDVTITLNDQEIETIVDNDGNKTFAGNLAEEENTLKFTADGKVVTVVVNREEPASNELESLTINGQNIEDLNNNEINYNTENDPLYEESVEIQATATEGATIEGTGNINLVEGLNEININVTNNGLTKTYKVNIYRGVVDATITATADNSANVSLVKENDTFSGTVAYNVNQVTLNAEGYTLDVTTIDNLNEGENSIVVTVTKGNLSKQYTVVITKEAEPV